MKKVFFLLFIAIPFLGFCQNDSLPRNNDGKVEFTAMVKVDSVSSEVLYSRAKLFIAEAFVSGKSVSQLADDLGKQLVGNGSLSVSVRLMGKSWDMGYVKFKITVQVKEGKYRYFVTDLIHENVGKANGGSGGPLELEKPLCGTLQLSKKYWKEIKEDAAGQIKKMLVQLDTYMRGQTKASADNW